MFHQRLSINLSHSVSADIADKVISAGATSVRSVIDPRDLSLVLQAYSRAVTQIFVGILGFHLHHRHRADC